MKEFPKRLEQYQSANFFIMSIIIGAMAVIATLPSIGSNGLHLSAPWMKVAFVGIIITTLVLSIISMVLSIKNWRK